MSKRQQQTTWPYRVEYQDANGKWVQVRKTYRSAGTASFRAQDELTGDRKAVRVVWTMQNYQGRPEDTVVYHQVA